MGQEHRTIHDLLTTLWDVQHRAWQKGDEAYKPGGSHRETYNLLRPKTSALEYTTKEQFELALESLSNGKLDFGRNLLLLPPILDAAGFVPLLSMRLPSTKDAPESVSIEVCMCTCCDGQLKRLPIRFESGSGMHDFFHAQFGTSDVDLPLPWLSTSQPSFPLLACCASTLLVSVLLSLYGAAVVNQLIPSYSKIHNLKKVLTHSMTLGAIVGPQPRS